MASEFVVEKISYTTESCYSCGTRFAMDSEFMRNRRDDHKEFFCPNGHRQYYLAESYAKRLEGEKRQVELELQARINQEQHARMVAEKALVAEKRRYTRMKNRVAHGVCPCCNKTFKDLSNHMVTEHKDFRLEGRERKRITAA